MNYKIDFVENRKKFFALSIAITLLGIITLLIFNLNYGVDFRSGTTLDITIGKSIAKTQAEAKADVEKLLSGGGGPQPKIVTLGGDNDRVTARYDRVLTQDESEKVIGNIKSAFGSQVTYEENTVDVEMAKELALKAIQAVAYASIGIIIYVSIRFEWRFAIAAIVALLHDAFIVVSFFSILRLEVNLPFVAAVLTIIGYSINDTIVIFDRIRENLRFAKLKKFSDIAEVVNRSIWQTMTRSINTVLTVLVAALCLFIFGSPAIRLFSLAMIVGLVSGAYSSIFIASPIWILLKNRSLSSKKTTAAK